MYRATLYALKSGVNHIDSVPLYGNIEEVGRAIKGCGRNGIIVTAKVSRDSLKTHDVVGSIKRTMESMGLNYLDEVILHEPIDHIENWALLSEFYQTEGRGLIGTIGVSNFNQDHLQDILSDTETLNPSVNQIEINPFLTRGNLPLFCVRNGIKIVAHSPLAKGELLHSEGLIDIAEKYGVTGAQLMLKWGIQNGFRVIPRSADYEHIEENMELGFEIEPQDMQKLCELDCGYSTHPKYLTKTEKQRFSVLRAEYKKKQA